MLLKRRPQKLPARLPGKGAVRRREEKPVTGVTPAPPATLAPESDFQPPDCETHTSAVHEPPGLRCFVTAAGLTRMTPDPCPPSTWALRGHSALSLGCSRWLPSLPPPAPAGPEADSVCQAHRRPPRHDACWPEFRSEAPSQPEGRGLSFMGFSRSTLYQCLGDIIDFQRL